jgi:DNA-binding transcriptional LysR family regulator
MRVEYLEYLLAVIRCGSMNKAAKEMFCSQPTITNAIKCIEDELGYRVLERSAHGMVPTKLGRQVLADSSSIVEFVHRWKQIGDTEKDAHNTVSVSYIGSINKESLIKVILRLEKTNPELSIQLNYSMDADYRLLRRGVQEGEKPVARIGLYLELPQNAAEVEKYATKHGMVMLKLLDSQYGVFARTDNALMKKDRLLIADIQNLNMVMYSSFADFPYRQYLDDLDIDYHQQLGDDENVLLAVATGNCIAIRPISVAKNNYYVKSGIIGCKTFDDAPLRINHYVMCPANEFITPSERIFVDALRVHYALS